MFAPVAGALSRGATPAELNCEEFPDFVRLALARPRPLPDGSLEAAVIHVDRFGNLVTSLTPRHVREDDLKSGRARILIGDREVRDFRRFYAQGDAAGPFAIWGSAGFLEISLNLGSAAQALDARRGQKITVEKDVNREP